MTMKNTVNKKPESLVEYADSLSESYITTYNIETRKPKGQFFTPKQVSTYMAGLFSIPRKTNRLLDPGAGTGILTAAVCERLLAKSTPTLLSIDAYENDPDLVPLLEKTLALCKQRLEENGHTVHYTIHEKDFILHNNDYFRDLTLFWKQDKPRLYDMVIANPPYYKLNKNSPQSTGMARLVSGQPNIYALFMGLAARMTKPGGELVFITPRSFCSGLYYRKFRHWFIENARITNIHTFESRKDIFDNDGILQENVIIKAKVDAKQKQVTITTSKDKTFTKVKKLNVAWEDGIARKNGDIFIRIPSSHLDLDILRIIDKWPTTLNQLGLEISTGPVVDFRAKEYLLAEKIEESVPLLWMHNLQDGKVKWPLKKNNKPSAIQDCEKTKSLLLPVKNYVLVKRFTAKEQKRRLYAALLLESEFSYDTVGIENHLNYIHKPKARLSVFESYGIAAILNSTVIDNFFRSLNGSTQVNATDIRSVPFPTLRDIIEIGRQVRETQAYNDQYQIDEILGTSLGINPGIIKQLRRGEQENE
jgi:adenine-specific DNA-methyltransferase